jgi:hypothetical protein
MIVFASVFKNRVGRTFSTAEIVKLMSSDSDIQIGSILPNDHGEGNKGERPCVGTERQIFERVDRGMYAFEISEVRNGCSEAAQRARWAKVRAGKKKAA